MYINDLKKVLPAIMETKEVPILVGHAGLVRLRLLKR